MKMENYSPSHPTDDIDIEDSDQIKSKDNSLKFVDERTRRESNLIMGNCKPTETSIEGVFKRIVDEIADVESSAWGRELASIKSHSPEKSHQTQSNKSSNKNVKRSRSKSSEKRSISKVRSNRSRSRSRSGNKCYNSRSNTRRSSSRSRSKNRSNHIDSRDSDSRSRKQISRSKSPVSRFQANTRDLHTLIDQRRDNVHISRSPESRPAYDRRDDNIFNKLTELQSMPVNDSPKAKWGCDSDEEIAPVTAKQVQDSFPDNRNRGEQQPFRGRQDFGDRRGRGSFRSFQRNNYSSGQEGRNKPWEDNRRNDFLERDARNKPWADTRGEQEVRNKPWADNRGGDFGEQNLNKKSWADKESDNFPEQESIKQPWADEDGENFGERDTTKKTWADKEGENFGEQEMRNKPWADNRRGAFGGRGAVNRTWADNRGGNFRERGGRNRTWADNRIGTFDEQGARNNSRVFNRGGNFDEPNMGNKPREESRSETVVHVAKNDCDSEEEFGSWGKKDKIDIVTDVGVVKEWSNEDNVESKKAGFETQGWGNNTKKNWGYEGDNNNKPSVRSGAQSTVRESGEGGFVAWKNAQKAEAAKATVVVAADKFTNDSDEESRAWGTAKKGESDQEGEVRVVTNKPMTKTAAGDSDEEFGAWGSEQKSTTAAEVNQDSFTDAPRGEDQFSVDERGNYQGKNSFGSNNQFGQRRGGQSNFSNNRFQAPQNQDRFFNNAKNTANNFQNYNNAPPANAAPNSMIPAVNYNYDYKPPQVPQWAMPPQQMTNMPYQPYSSSQLPFSLDTTVCPPMNMLQQQMHQPSMQMMQQIPYIPPPPPNIAMDLNNAPGSTSGIMGYSSMQLGQSAMNMGQSGHFNQSAMNIGQSGNINQSAMNMGQLSNINQSVINMRQAQMNMSQPPIHVSQSSSNTIIDNNNLLETLMTKAGLSSDSLRLTQDKRHDTTRSVNDTFNTILKTAATSVITRLVESSQQKSSLQMVGNISDNMSMSPPSPPSNSPPPPLSQLFPLATRHTNHPLSQQVHGFIPPPLPIYADILKPSTNKLTNKTETNLSSSAVKSSEVEEEKRCRTDFDSKIDWQERVALEVKVFLKPAYMSRGIDKNDYKEIMKRCVTKITRSGVTEINRDKIEKFVLSYVDKYNKNKKVKQHSTVSSSG